MKAVVFAYHTIGCVGLESLLRHGFDVLAVFTHADSPAENTWFRSVAQLAAEKDVPVFAPTNINHPLWIEKIQALQPDIIFSFYYRTVLSPALLDIPPAGCLNLHGSLLPRYRGRVPVNWVLVNGESETGVTLHYMTPQPDAGDIVYQRKTLISDEYTAQSLHEKLAATAAALLDACLPQLRTGSASRLPQDHSLATTYPGRRPEDGEIDWQSSPTQIRNLVRAVTRPYPGAFSYIGGKKCIMWAVSHIPDSSQAEDVLEDVLEGVLPDILQNALPGTILSTQPLRVACRAGAIQIDFAQLEDGLYVSGRQLVQDCNLVTGMRFGPQANRTVQAVQAAKKTRVLILGVNGFIGNFLSEKLLESGRYEVHGMDLCGHTIERLLDEPDFHFSEGDISIHREWIEYHIKKADVVVPLVAIATPIAYTRNPLEVFELDFEENLRIIRYCVKYGKRVIFPSTSEVYGMCDEDEFNEDQSTLVLGPIRMQRWIYACSKQLLDRVIWAYGQKENLAFTLFRPFNWIGPRLDSLSSARIGSSRAITQLILNLVEGTPILLIDGGQQQRCFTDVTDGIECLYRIIENIDGRCDGQIINIGNPDNAMSIKNLAQLLVDKFEDHPLRAEFPPFAGFREVESEVYYGPGYQDVQHRRPSIRNARRCVNWCPYVPLEQSVETTLDFFLHEAVRDQPTEKRSVAL